MEESEEALWQQLPLWCKMLLYGLSVVTAAWFCVVAICVVSVTVKVTTFALGDLACLFLSFTYFALGVCYNAFKFSTWLGLKTKQWCVHR